MNNLKNNLGYEWWESLLKAQATIQESFPDCILVGGTASALHCDHRISIDGDHVIADLKEKFDTVLHELERQAGWITNKISPPVMILGSFEGIETGLRQLIREKPLETMTVRGIRIPTIKEMARIKGYLVVRRNATRDYLDFCALADKLGSSIIESMASMDDCYPQKGTETIMRQLCKQLADPVPYDLKRVHLRQYKGLKEPYNEWGYISMRCRQISLLLVERIVLGVEEGNDSPAP
ncbi:hypothetical protein [Syntrophorhabdus aromaticivorans]|uniref:hypothetical protein n=1 Tax=Syntrophorhabdus aromaticivorans TaxID=328301 RepID=UPI000408D3A1|nr:hypothetical protein [Syntrophorhabdus aromaticivorans]HBA54681.1 hypothetical protein [Syntrophorhabdus aromaticivorans]